MGKTLLLLVLIGIGAGAWFAYQHLDHKTWNLGRLLPSGEGSGDTRLDDRPAPPPSQRRTIRIASFNLGRFDETKLGNARVREIIAQLIARHDLVALQDIQAANQGLLVRLLDDVNAAGHDYDFVVAAEVGVNGPHRYNAFAFDRASIEVARTKDRDYPYAVSDPAGRLSHKPLVGMFRTRAAAPAEAFSFILINVEIEADRAESELPVLDDVYRAVCKSQPDEDDVLMLGTFYADDARLAHWDQLFTLSAAIRNTPTTTRGAGLTDNILYNPRATTEFTHRAGVVDLMREFGLSMQEALEVSEHLPVWAEFSVFEGGASGMTR